MTPGRTLFAFFAYEPLGIFLAILSLLRGYRTKSRRILRTGLWLGVALLLAVFYRQTSELVWVIIPLLTLAALEGTLALYRSGRAGPPVLQMLTEPAESVRSRAERLAELTGGKVEPTVARAGGGSLPTTDLESFACALEESLAEPLRRGDPPVIGIVRDGVLLLDCRTLSDEEVEVAARTVNECRSR